MSRLTKRVIDEVFLCDAESSICKEICESMDNFDHPCEVCQINEALKKLAHYEDLEEQGRLINEEDVLKFYYIDSEDKYVVGQRLDTMYYAKVTERFSLAFYMSRYLPWGEHVVDEKSAWKEHTYCSEPREIPFTEWLKGFMEQQAKLAELGV